MNAKATGTELGLFRSMARAGQLRQRVLSHSLHLTNFTNANREFRIRLNGIITCTNCARVQKESCLRFSIDPRVVSDRCDSYSKADPKQSLGKRGNHDE